MLNYKSIMAGILLFTSLYANTQTFQNPSSIAWRWTWNNFQYPISNEFQSADYSSGVELSYARYLNRTVNLAFPLKMGKADLPLNDLGNVEESQLYASLDVLMQIKILSPEIRFNPYLIGGVGLMTEIDNDWDLHPEFPLGLGINYRLTDHLYLSGESQFRVNLADNRNQLMHSLGILFTFDQPKEKEIVQDDDRDKDGVPDQEDQCPDIAGVAELFGCPDTDGDGLADHIDDCPDEPGPVANKGCPVKDRDGDGVADEDDACPLMAGLPENNGCPDTDGDGTIDPDDKCPTTPGPPANLGCPELKQEEKEVLDFAMKAVQFETGSARLKPSSHDVLDQIAEIMNRYPERKLRISGHTDSIGSAEDNKELSERRAKACYNYLVIHGVDAGRITYRGFGESQPIGNNLYKDGREKNRRVEFEIYVE